MLRRRTLIQLTDVHLLDGLLHGVADTMRVLDAALEMIVGSGEDISAIVVSGDLADRGDEASYRRGGDTLRAAAEKVGAVLVVVPGNHDDGPSLRAVVGGSARPDHVVTVDGLRIVALDSTVPRQHHGELDDRQLDWLRTELAEPALHGTVLVLHHPPIASALPVFERISLRAPQRLADVLVGSDVRLILAGHTHSATAGALAGIPVWVGPACAYAQDALAPAGLIRALGVHAMTRVDITADSVIATQVPIVTADVPVVYEVDAARAEALAVERADLTSDQIVASDVSP
jgi:3',5'-cyclic AMP phosphodiesterase CpdA